MVPVLSRGKHRNPRKGACFMEYASLLAGERWTDHPQCSHPLLAAVARQVNDHISDGARSRLVGLIPEVIGLNGDDPRLDAVIATRCAATAIPVAAEHRQRALAVGLLASQRFLLQMDGEDGPSRGPDPIGLAGSALKRFPHAARWAEDFAIDRQMTPKAYRRRSAPAIVRVAVAGIAEAATADPDAMLYELLASVIHDCTEWLRREPSPASPWARLPTTTG